MKRCKRILSFIIAIAIVCTALLSNVGTVKADATDALIYQMSFASLDSLVQNTTTYCSLQVMCKPSVYNTYKDPDSGELIVDISLSSSNLDIISCTDDTLSVSFDAATPVDSVTHAMIIHVPVKVTTGSAYGSALIAATDITPGSTQTAKTTAMVTFPPVGMEKTDIHLNPEDGLTSTFCVGDASGGVATQYRYYSSDPNVATVTQSPTDGKITVTAVANGMAVIYSGNVTTGYTAAQVTVTGLASDAEPYIYTQSAYTVQTAPLLALQSDYSTVSLGFQQTWLNNWAAGVYRCKFTEAINADEMTFSLYSGVSTAITYLKNWVASNSLEDVYNSNGTIASYGLNTLLFKYINIYEVKDDSKALTKNISSDMADFLLGDKVASFADGTLYYNADTGKICVKADTLQKGHEYVLAIDARARRLSVNSYLNCIYYYYFETMDDMQLYKDAVSKLETFSYTDAYAALLQQAKSQYAMLSDGEKASTDDGIPAAYQEMGYYQQAYDLITAINDLSSSAITLNSWSAISSARTSYNQLVAAGYDQWIGAASYTALVNAEKEYNALLRIQTITVSSDNIETAYGTEPFNLGAETDGQGTFSYASSDSSVAEVDGSGNVTVKGVGTATLTVHVTDSEDRYDDAEKTVSITVAKGTQSIAAQPGSVAGTFLLNAVSNGDGGLSYASSNPSVATVDAAGKVTVKSTGTVTFTIDAAETSLYNAARKTITMDITALSGKTYISGSLKYKVTDARSDGSGTVSVTGAASGKPTSVSIGSAVKIGNHSYKVTAISAGAFQSNKSLVSVRIGSKVSAIGSKTFYGDSKLAKIIISSNVLKTVGSNAIKGIRSTAVIDVPNAKKTAYKKLFQGKGLGSKMTVK